MAKDLMGYDLLVDAAIRSVVREALRKVEKTGLLGSHHFYLTFKTHDPGVDIPDFLKERYPDEMTIVLQNQYWGLKVNEDRFEVTLTFQKLPASLTIPFAALTAFNDPSAQFGLQFRNSSAAPPALAPARPPEAPAATLTAPAAAPATEASPPPEKTEEAQVVSLDKFRKK
jgi:hypothetical protein